MPPSKPCFSAFSSSNPIPIQLQTQMLPSLSFTCMIFFAMQVTHLPSTQTNTHSSLLWLLLFPWLCRLVIQVMGRVRCPWSSDDCLRLALFYVELVSYRLHVHMGSYFGMYRCFSELLWVPSLHVIFLFCFVSLIALVQRHLVDLSNHSLFRELNVYMPTYVLHGTTLDWDFFKREKEKGQS